jgi:hypothetical protein
MKVELNRFIGRGQLLAIKEACRGEEGKYFRAMITDWAETIARMPKTYETDGQGDEAPVTLHYFLGGSDWYIIEKDQEAEQIQAFGFACLNGDIHNAESGYISIEELIKYGVELDLYYKPETIGEVVKRFKETS